MTSGNHPPVLQCELLQAAARLATTAEFLPESLGLLCRAVGAARGALAVVEAGRWQAAGVFPAGATLPLPVDLLADVLDAGGARAHGNWVALALNHHGANREILLVAIGADGTGDAVLRALEPVVPTFQLALNQVRASEKVARRIGRLETILSIYESWNGSCELETLLVQLAEAATRLLDADRASIFLWDKAHRTLVARPALGLPENELRIPDDAGIVGQVLHQGEPRRVASNLDQREINRAVDRNTGYQTHTLLCVPMRTAGGEICGVFEVLNKRQGNFTDEDEAALTELARHAAHSLEATQQFEHLLNTRKRLVDQAAERVQLIGESPAMEKLRSTVARVAQTDLAVLVLGENGTGKEVVAQSIHYQSRRRAEPFIAVNCAAIAETLLESELFGHEKGAFTDAREARAGKFELARGGTLFLDEIGDLSAAGQAKLLRVLEEKTVVRVGGSQPIATDVRVVAATNQNLAEMVREKRFRQDLYFRLNVVSLELPPLRDRGDDVLLLAEHFLAHFCRQAKRKPLKLTPAARGALAAHRWSGNIRELRNLMERLAYLSTDDTVNAGDLGLQSLAGSGEGVPSLGMDGSLASATDAFQIAHIRQMIARTRGNMSDAAARLGLHRSNLYRKMRQLGMDTRDE